jgi:hypothetical protein
MGEVKTPEEAQQLVEVIRANMLSNPLNDAVVATMDFYFKRHFRVIERRDVIAQLLQQDPTNATPNKG